MHTLSLSMWITVFSKASRAVGCWALGRQRHRVNLAATSLHSCHCMMRATPSDPHSFTLEIYGKAEPDPVLGSLDAHLPLTSKYKTSGDWATLWAKGRNGRTLTLGKNLFYYFKSYTIKPGHLLRGVKGKKYISSINNSIIIMVLCTLLSQMSKAISLWHLTVCVPINRTKLAWIHWNYAQLILIEKLVWQLFL